MFPSTLFDWVRQTDIEGGGREGVTKEQAEDLQQLPRHNRLLEHEKKYTRELRHICPKPS
jgi:transposase-like protein